MPSYMAAPEERPIAPSGDQPSRQIARKKGDPAPPPAQRPSSALTAGTGAKERARLEEDLRPAADPAAEPVRRFGDFVISREPPPPKRQRRALTPLGVAVRDLQPGEHIKLGPDPATRVLVRAVLENLKKVHHRTDFEQYLAEGKQFRIVRRLTAEEAKARGKA